jgi:hypothetical protein
MIKQFRKGDKVKVVRHCTRKYCHYKYLTGGKCIFLDCTGTITNIQYSGTYYYRVGLFNKKKLEGVDCSRFTAKLLKLVESSLKPFGIVKFWESIK